MNLDDYAGGNPLLRGYRAMSDAPTDGTKILCLGGQLEGDHPYRMAHHPCIVSWVDGQWRTVSGLVLSAPDCWRPEWH